MHDSRITESLSDIFGELEQGHEPMLDDVVEKYGISKQSL